MGPRKKKRQGAVFFQITNHTTQSGSITSQRRLRLLLVKLGGASVLTLNIKLRSCSGGEILEM